MDDLKSLSDPNSILQISNGLQKLCTSIRKQIVDERTDQNNIKEIEFLKELCKSPNVQLSLLACQALLHLAEECVLHPCKVMSMFVWMWSVRGHPNTTAIAEGIVSSLLLELKLEADCSRPGSAYKCGYGLLSLPHPIIFLLQKRDPNNIDIATKINGICNHHDSRIRNNSIAFLRPVFLYVVSNPNVVPDSKRIWNCLLARCLHSEDAMELLRDAFNWSRYETPEACLNVGTMLNEAIECLVEAKRFSDAFDLQIYQIALLKELVVFGYDCRPSLDVLNRTLRLIELNDGKQATDFYNYLLILFADLVHSISPVYLEEALIILTYVIETQNCGNAITRNMILDALIIRVANANSFLSANCRRDCESLIKYISSPGQNSTPRQAAAGPAPNYSTHWNGQAKYQHARIAVAYDLAIWSEQLLLQYSDCVVINPNLAKFLIQLERSAHMPPRIQLFLRSLLLLPSNIVDEGCWLRIWTIMMSVVKAHISVSIDMIYFVLYLLARERDGCKQVHILRGLSEFGLVKENIPLILNTYRALSASTSVALQTLAIDLHVRLWKNESRAYQFLHKMLSAEYKIGRKVDAWELNIVKAHAIKEICELKPTQHGKDLVVHLSDILNASADEKNDLATALALDAIILLCNSHTVNIASTWKALGGKFANESRLRSTKSLCEFFGAVPLLQSPTADYDTLFYHALRQLWAYVTDFDTAATIEPALNALKNFNMADLALKHIPAIFQEDLRIPSEYQKQIAAANENETNEPLTAADVVPYIPGECWIQLLEKVNQSAIGAAVELVYQLIENEIGQFRSGVYMLTGGRTEPNELTQLHARSPLRAMTKYVAAQSKLPRPDNVAVLLNCLQCLSRKFSKPIPPFDWFFLLDLLDKGYPEEECPYQLRTYCLKLASHQIANSGSARNLIENYVQQFSMDDHHTEEIQCVLMLVPQMCHGCNSDILRQFLDAASEIAYKQSKSCGFEKNCLLEALFAALVPVYQSPCLMVDNVAIVTELFKKYYNILDAEHKFFRTYSQSLISLPIDDLQELTAPDSWTKQDAQKASIVRGQLCDANIRHPTDNNSLVWLNLVISNAQNAEQQQKVISQVFLLLTARPRPDRQVVEWLMHLLEKTQASITASEPSQCSYLVHIFMLGISVVSGMSVFSNTAPTLTDHVIALFPESLAALSAQIELIDLMIRVYEFLYYFLTTQEIFAVDMSSAMHNALMCCKNNAYFLQKPIWKKYIALKLDK